MVYPLFFPLGDQGWYCGMEHTAERRTAHKHNVSVLQFYSFRLAVRQTFSPLFHGGKLFQQYVVDAYLRAEAARLDYIRINQTSLRREMYQGLIDHVNSQAEELNLEPGTIVILPSSFKGSPRGMQQNFQDAMAMVAKFGKPDLFLTFTCNPRCKDITDSLPKGHRPEHRPDIVARVFQLQLKELMKDLTQRNILGMVAAYIYVIEFQKRGLPHVHLLIILANNSKLRLAADVDSLICAEIPDEQADLELYQTVTKTMVHGPCGILNPNSVCMDAGKCTKDYPKDFHAKTILPNDSYPHYRRRDNGKTITIKVRNEEVQVDNRWIVPYNAYLSKKFNSHINLEACTSIQSVKYLFKYVYKGYDCANVQVTATDTLNHDEIQTYLDARYVSAPEAMWRISEFKMNDRSHSVLRLPVHLPDQQPVHLKKGQHVAALQVAQHKHTMLTAFFKLNEDSQTEFCYPEIPNHFVWNSKGTKWVPRKLRGDKMIARMYFVSPRDMEKYCLRLLLLHIPGPTSYEDLRMVNGTILATFKQACILRNLMADDVEWDHAMEEASGFQMPSQLRSLFATICIHCQPTDPLHLWEVHKEAMAEDFTHSDNVPAPMAEFRALQEIEAILLQNGMSTKDLGLPDVDNIQPFHQDFDREREHEEATAQMGLLNNEQRALVDTVLQALEHIRQGHPPQCQAFFLDGPGGSGKTMVYNAIIAHCRSEGITVAPTAWTGIAATLLAGGRTVHNLFKLPVPIVETSICHISPASVHATFLRSITMFIIDEASMVPTHALSAIDNMLQDITANSVPFGGKIFLLGGDFRQVLPVVPRSPRTVIVENCIKSSPLWAEFQVFKLKHNMRAGAGQQEFATWLLALGNGELACQEPAPVMDSIPIPAQCHMSEGDIIDDVFPDLSDPAALANQVILTPTNDASLKLNEHVLKRLPGAPKVYLSSDTAICDAEQEAVNYTPEFLNSLTPSGMPPHKLSLKPDAIIMLLRNLDIHKCLCNGTRLIVHKLHERVLDAKIITGTHKGDRVLIPRIKLAPSDASLPFTLQRIQFPIRLSYSMTINKSHGQTFDRLGIHLSEPVFSHGQLYVAFSRARSFKDIHVKICQCTTQGLFNGRYITRNVVFKEVL
jgi:hypothetical protein